VVDALAVGAAVVGELFESEPVADEVVVDGALVRDDVEIVEESGDVIRIDPIIRFLNWTNT
jgi:hypothetical protein